MQNYDLANGVTLPSDVDFAEFVAYWTATDYYGHGHNRTAVSPDDYTGNGDFTFPGTGTRPNVSCTYCTRTLQRNVENIKSGSLK